MKSKIKFLILSSALLIAATSCDSDPFETYTKEIKKLKHKNDRVWHDTGGQSGENNWDSAAMRDTVFQMKVGYLPSQCDVHKATNVLGLERNGYYYRINADNSGKFGNYKAGEVIRVYFSYVRDCKPGTSCDSPAPQYCVNIIDIY